MATPVTTEECFSFCSPCVHHNVGRGYTNQSLTDYSREWMIGKAKKHDVIFNEKSQGNLMSDPKGRLDNSSVGFWGIGGGHILPRESGTDFHTPAYPRISPFVGIQPANLPGYFMLWSEG